MLAADVTIYFCGISRVDHRDIKSAGGGSLWVKNLECSLGVDP